ncbi:MAG TPA: hypothetical protein ENK06_03890 [Gammaproteobacteria bacterium]|nr:hypothetical protein [Gammaproteobacteria bacterium]
MSKKQKDLPKKWQASNKAMRAIQVAFYVDEKIQTKIRQDACLKGISPSDLIRQITQLPVSAPPKRPRLTASLNPDDYAMLAARYNLNPEDTLEIKRKVMQELIKYATTPETDNDK